MKAKNLSIALIFMMGCSLVFLSSCAKKFVMNNTGIAPAATGTAKIKSKKDRNYNVDVRVNHLAPSKKLNPSRNTYVVWMQTESNGIKNIGQFQSGTSLLSSALKGSVKTITPFKPTGFFITAEDDAAISYPGSMVILKSN